MTHRIATPVLSKHGAALALAAMGALLSSCSAPEIPVDVSPIPIDLADIRQINPIPSVQSIQPGLSASDFGRHIEISHADYDRLATWSTDERARFRVVDDASVAEFSFVQCAPDVRLEPEGYRLTIENRSIAVCSPSEQGSFYGLQTLRQLISNDAASTVELPNLEIVDSPRFAWRGVMLDVSRHFFGKETMMRMLDEMARYKLNVLHLHLTDDPGWRIEIPGYPRLTEIGGRGDRSNPEGEPQFYTAEDIEEIVAYAAERHILIVPEIDMPGHSAAAARAYPEFFDGDRTFNPANEGSYEFIRDVFTEIARLFPGPYIHFGGDEVRYENWAEMPDVLALQQREGLEDKAAMEGYFGRRVTDIILSLGKRPMAWDEQVSAGANTTTLIQWWRKYQPEVRDQAVRTGYDVVLSPADQVYFDYPQGPGEPGAPWEGNDNGPTSITKILAWEPVPESYSAEEIARVRGVEAALWTEFIRTEDYLEFMAFPRLLAFAEVAWGPRGPRDLEQFNNRLAPHITGLRERGINARRDDTDAAPYMTH